jgi:hypothetical protein
MDYDHGMPAASPTSAVGLSCLLGGWEVLLSSFWGNFSKFSLLASRSSSFDVPCVAKATSLLLLLYGLLRTGSRSTEEILESALKVGKASLLHDGIINCMMSLLSAGALE